MLKFMFCRWNFMVPVVFFVIVNGHGLSGLTSCCAILCAVVMFTHNNIHCNAICVYSLLVHTVSLTTFIDVLHLS
jgi:fumarate reductase subunit C